MQDWDRTVFVLLGGAVALYTSYGGWRAWQKQKRGQAIGTFLLAIATAAVPILLAIFGT